MKNFIAIALATTALIAAAPAFAQNNGSNDALRSLRNLLGAQPADPAEQDLSNQERHLTDVLEQSTNEHRIDRGQADRAFGELRTIRGQEDDLRARHGGRLTQGDHDYVRDRLAGLDREVDQMRDAGDRSHDRADNAPPPRFDQGRDQGQGRDHDQGRDHGDFWDRAPRDLDQRADWLDQRIHGGMADGSLDRGDARRSLQQLQLIRQDEANYSRRDRGELSDQHRADLTERLDDLGRQLRWNRDNRG